MLRCPPTTIILGRSDLLDYDKRRSKERATESIDDQFARFAVGKSDGPRFNYAGPRKKEIRVALAAEKDPLPQIHTITSAEDSIAQSSTAESDDAGDAIDLLHDISLSSIEADCSNENPSGTSESTTPIKNEFDYGGFVESSTQPDADATPRRSSPFSAPDSASTPQEGQFLDAQGLRLRRPLPRSPLYLSQNATSPESRRTTRLTPRVASRVARYDSPGIIFSQPARRLPRSTPRTFRHQTNSFSFDSSERASAAYEQERNISDSTDDAAHHNSGEVSLHEELRGSSLQSSRVSSAVVSTRETQSNNQQATAEADTSSRVTSRDFIFSSPGFPLPPPFSSVPRRASNADSLPSTTDGDSLQHPATSPIRSQKSTPNKDEVERSPTSLHGSSKVVPVELTDSPPSAGRIASFMRRIASYRVRSPQRAGPSASPSPASTSDKSQASNSPKPRTPGRRYRVYNDALSPATQPQTPANLPEARHQSRYHASYTAPVTRGAARREAEGLNADRTTVQGSVRRLPVSSRNYTPVRAGRRTDSPTGMREEGFEGLYGGRENGDDEQDWVAGVRYNNAETRVWGARDASNEGGTLRATPEPEDFRVGRRN